MQQKAKLARSQEPVLRRIQMVLRRHRLGYPIGYVARFGAGGEGRKESQGVVSLFRERARSVDRKIKCEKLHTAYQIVIFGLFCASFMEGRRITYEKLFDVTTDEDLRWMAVHEIFFLLRWMKGCLFR